VSYQKLHNKALHLEARHMESKLKEVFEHIQIDSGSISQAIAELKDWSESAEKMLSIHLASHLITIERNEDSFDFVVSESTEVAGISIIQPGSKTWKFSIESSREM